MLKRSIQANFSWNWNSALAWVSSFLADQGTGQPAAGVSCAATYTMGLAHNLPV